MSFKSTKQFVNYLFEYTGFEDDDAADRHQDQINRQGPYDYDNRKPGDPSLESPGERERRLRREEEASWGGYKSYEESLQEDNISESKMIADLFGKKNTGYYGSGMRKSSLDEQMEPEYSDSKEESPKEIVSKAIDKTPKEYMERTLGQRNPGAGSAGSTFLENQTAESLKDADWKPLTHSPENVRSDTIAFEANIPGKLGAADIKDYPDDQPAVIQPAHAGKGVDRATGKLMAEVGAILSDGMPTVEFTTIILGPKDKPKDMVVYTFHPGPPAPSIKPIFLEDMKKEFGTMDDKILTTIGKAKKLGFITIKNVDSLPTSMEEKPKEEPLKESRMYQDLFGKQSGFNLNHWQKMAGILKG